MDLLNNLYGYSQRNTNFLSKSIKKLLCIREDYKELVSTGSVLPDISWLIDGSTLEASIWNVPEVIDARCETYEYHTHPEHIITKTHAQKIKLGDLFCCGCRFPYYPPCPFFRAMYSDMRDLKEGESPFGELMKIFETICARDHVGRLIFSVNSSVDEQNGEGYLKSVVWEPLSEAKFDVPFLHLKSMGWTRIDLTPFLELITFKRLIMITEEPLLLNYKILNCDLLFLDVPILNIEELDKFNGFALLLGKREKNNLSLDLVCEQIEKYMEDIPSKIEFFAVYDQEKWVTEEMIERLKSYSIQDDDDFPKPECIARETILRLDKEDNAAILIRGNKTVIFVRSGWRKWQEFLESLWLVF